MALFTFVLAGAGKLMACGMCGAVQLASGRDLRLNIVTVNESQIDN